MKKLFVCMVLLLLLCACDAGKNFPVDPEVLSSAPESSAPTELHLCGETYPLDVTSLSLDERFTVEDAVQLPYAEKLEVLSLQLSHAYLAAHGEAALDFLAFCPSIQELSLHTAHAGAEIPLEVLTRNPKLHTLRLSGGAADLTILSRCTGLKTLFLEGTQTELTGLSGMKLEKLYLTGFQDLSGLETMQGVDYVCTVGSETGFEALGKIGVKRLNVVNTAVNPYALDVNDILKVTTLETLDFSDATLEDISPLFALENLHTLVIWMDWTNEIDRRGETVTADNMERLESLATPISLTQLQEFLQREGASILLVQRWQ